MPPDITSLNIFMEKTKPPIKAGTADDLAAVKAAAWAWYGHGSGSEGKSVSEFVPTRTRQVAKPSRYRLEAMRMTEEDSIEGSKRPSSVHTDNSLLDSYEIECISRQLDFLMRSSENMFNNNKFPDGNLHRQKSVASESDRDVKKSSKKLMDWFLLRHGIICGTRQDVDARALVRSRRQPERHAPVV